MIAAVYASQVAHGPVSLPLKSRENPLAAMKLHTIRDRT
jgi:hypothetical protein